jgi:hypothetical protein
VSRTINKRVFGCLIGAGVLALILLTPPAYMIFSAFTDMRRIGKIEKELQKSAVYEPVGETLALCCQSDDNKNEIDNWVPIELKEFAMGPGWTSIDPDAALVELGGGFHHFGYRLELDKRASSLETNVWLLYFESEDRPDSLLETFSLPTSTKMAADELRKRLSKKTPL